MAGRLMPWKKSDMARDWEREKTQPTLLCFDKFRVSSDRISFGFSGGMSVAAGDLDLPAIDAKDTASVLPYL